MGEFELGHVLAGGDDSPFEMDASLRLDQIRVGAIEKRIHSIVGGRDADTMATVEATGTESRTRLGGTDDPTWRVGG